MEEVKKNNSFLNEFTKNQKLGVIIGILIVLVLVLGIFGIINLMQAPQEVSPMQWSTILKFLFICVGVGWAFHGVGFVIVRYR